MLVYMEGVVYTKQWADCWIKRQGLFHEEKTFGTSFHYVERGANQFLDEIVKKKKSQRYCKKKRLEGEHPFAHTTGKKSPKDGRVMHYMHPHPIPISWDLAACWALYPLYCSMTLHLLTDLVYITMGPISLIVPLYLCRYNPNLLEGIVDRSCKLVGGEEERIQAHKGKSMRNRGILGPMSMKRRGKRDFGLDRPIPTT